MRAPRAVLGPVKRGVTDTPRREGSGEARVSHHPLACPRYFTHYTGGPTDPCKRRPSSLVRPK